MVQVNFDTKFVHYLQHLCLLATTPIPRKFFALCMAFQRMLSQVAIISIVVLVLVLPRGCIKRLFLRLLASPFGFSTQDFSQRCHSRTYIGLIDFGPLIFPSEY